MPYFFTSSIALPASTFLMLTSTTNVFAAVKALSTSGGSGYKLLSPRWIDPTRYTVAVGDVAFHIRKRLDLAGCCVATWAWAAPRNTSSKSHTAWTRSRLHMRGLLNREKR